MPPADEDALNHSRMSFGDHLEELRRRLILAIAGVGVVSIGTLIYGRQLVAIVRLPLAQVQRKLGVPDHVFAFSPFAPFSEYMKLSLIAGLIIASPWVLYQGWKFVSSGLYHHERRVAYILAPFSAIMTILGVLFSFFVMLPICLWFLLNFAVGYPAPGEGFSFIDRITDLATAQDTRPRDDHPAQSNNAPPLILPTLTTDPPDPVDGQAWFKLPERQYCVYHAGHIFRYQATNTGAVMPYFGLGEYLSFAMLMTLGIVIGFQLPVAMLILGWTGLVEPEWIARYRRHCMLGCFVLGAFLTPADPLSMFALALPLYLLFEFGLIVMKIARKHARQNADEQT